MRHNFPVQFLLILIIFFQSKAKTITVSNNPGIPAQFNNIQGALDAASSDPAKPDTLYIHKSPLKYEQSGGIKIKKKVVIIGNGHKSINLESTLGSWCKTIYLSDDAAGTVFMGLCLEDVTIYDNIRSNVTKNIDNLVFRRCRFADGTSINFASFNPFTSNNNIVEGCIFSANNILISKCNNMLFSNNIFGDYANVNGGDQNAYIFNNNVIVGTNGAIFNTIKNSIIANNIFYGRKLSNISGCSGNSFNNNIIYNASNDITVNGINSVTGTIPEIPIFKSFTGEPSRFSDIDIFYTLNFELSSNSPGINKGTDGKNIGLNPSFKMFGTPTLPQITSMIIANTVLNYGTPKGDDVIVKLKASGKK